MLQHYYYSYYQQRQVIEEKNVNPVPRSYKQKIKDYFKMILVEVAFFY